MSQDICMFKSVFCFQKSVQWERMTTSHHKMLKNWLSSTLTEEANASVHLSKIFSSKSWDKIAIHVEKRKCAYMAHLLQKRVSWFHHIHYAIICKAQANFRDINVWGWLRGDQYILEPMKQDMSAGRNILSYISNSHCVALPFKSLAEGLWIGYAKGTLRALIFKSEQTGS